MSNTEGRSFHFEPTLNWGHVLTVVALLSGGITVYIGIIQNVTILAARVEELEEKARTGSVMTEQTRSNSQSIAELRNIASELRDSNGKLLEQVTGMRIDIGTIKALQQGQQTIPSIDK